MNDDEKITSVPLWDLGIEELTGLSVEVKQRDEVNEKLAQGWVLLHIYTLKYKDKGEWRERPMVILGRPKWLKMRIPVQERLVAL